MGRMPRDVEVLEALGDLYTRAGRYEDGLAVDRKLTQLEPGDSTIWYNLGCSLALLNQREAALQALDRAVELGFSDHEGMLGDADLKSLREDGAFQSLVKRISPPVSTSQQES